MFIARHKTVTYSIYLAALLRKHRLISSYISLEFSALIETFRTDWMKTTTDGHLLQISPLTKDEDGSYECHASNIKGEASAVGIIHVVDSINDIPPKKGE